MKRMKWLLFIGGLFVALNSSAQGFNLRIDSLFLTDFPNTVHLYDTFTINITIHNDSTVAYNGRVSIQTRVNTDTVRIDSVPGTAFYYPTSSANESIPAGGSITRSLIVNVSNPPFIIGSSGVVIWPIVQINSSWINSDFFLSKYVTVLNPVGINEPSEKLLKVYMQGQQVMIQADPEHLLKSVKLYNVEGALLEEQFITTSGVINTTCFSSGIYLIDVTFDDNTHLIYKVFNGK